MRFGYACINTSLPTKFRTCRLKTVEEKGKGIIKELTLINFQQTLEAIKWNIEHNIRFYRLSSDLVVFATHEINDWVWWEDEDVLVIANEIKKLQLKHNLRLSCHPGQYNVLNSPNENVVAKTIEELNYHDKLMELVNGNDIILHIGGVYGDKESAILRFAENYKKLSESVKKRLRIENDDKSFSLKDVIDVHRLTEAPICFDIHHHNCHNNDEKLNELLPIVWDSWDGYGTPKCHISSGRTKMDDRSHHDYISEDDLISLIELLDGQDVDIMFEAKLKELSVLQLVDKQS